MKQQWGCNDLMENHRVDITHLIRSIQRLEETPDCFRVAEIQSGCDRMNCAWRKLCLERPQDRVDETR